MISPRVWIDRQLRRWFFTPSRGPLARAAHTALVPFVPLYKVARWTHQKWRRRSRSQLPRTVVSVGNLSMGGTGKTGFVIWLARRLSERGLRPAVLKRGEGAREGVVPANTSTTPLARAFGDESALIRHHFPELPIGVGRNRHRWAEEILGSRDVDVFVLDDGFQHRQLERDLDVVLLGGEFELDAWEIPAGPLREPVDALGRADYVSVKTPPNGSLSAGWTPPESACDVPRDRRLRHGYRLTHVVKGDRDVTEECRGEPVDVVTTLGRPDDLIDFLDQAEIDVKNHLVLPDHEPIDYDEVRSDLSARHVLVTEKEWIKLSPPQRRRVGLIRSEFRVRPHEGMLSAIERRVTGP